MSERRMVTIYFSDEKVLEVAQLYAAAHDLSFSRFINMLVEQFLKSQVRKVRLPSEGAEEIAHQQQ